MPSASSATGPLLDPRILARLEGLELRARRIVEGYVAGLHRSPYQGFSNEFAEHREYVPGDDLRYVDWKVFGKTDKFYLKQYEQETNLISYLVVDTSESMRYRSSQAAMSKLEYAQCAAASLAYLILEQQDSVGLATFDRELRAIVRPSSNPTHMRQLVHVLSESVPERKSAIGSIFHDLAERFKKRGLVLILSDLFDDVKSLTAGLKHFRHRRHEVVVLHVLDPAELDFPFRGPTEFKGLEGLPEVAADPQVIRRAYLREFAAFRESLESECRRQHIDYFLLRTDQPLDTALTRVLASRQRSVR